MGSSRSGQRARSVVGNMAASVFDTDLDNIVDNAEAIAGMVVSGSAATGQVLTATGALTGNWQALPTGVSELADLSDVTGKTGSGTTAVMSGNPTLTAPNISSFVNATHDHQAAAGAGQLDHGLAISGLADDDHTQYSLADGSRAFGAVVAGVTPTLAAHLATKGYVDGAIISDHGALGGLADDDHTQYALLAGRASGQAIQGGINTGESLTLESTAHATKGNIYLGSSAIFNLNESTGNLAVDTNTLYVDATNNRVGIGNTSPRAILEIGKQGGASGEIYLVATDWSLTYLRFVPGNTSTIYAARGGGYDTLTLSLTPTTSGGTAIATFNSPGISHTFQLDVKGLNGDGVVRVIDTTTDKIGELRMNRAGSVLQLQTTSNHAVAIGTNSTERMRFDTSGNVGLGQTSFGTNATKTFAVGTGVAPTTSPADAFQLYSADIVAGNAAPHFRTENDKIIKLYQQATIADADGTLADITAKFNTLLADLENTGLLATA